MHASPTGPGQAAAAEQLRAGERVSTNLAADRRWLAGAFFLVLVATRGYYLGDTTAYVADILTYTGKSSPAGPSLWEFGHLLWRPLGWLLLQLLAPVLTPLTGWEPGAICAFGLIAVNVVCGFLTALLWHLIASEIVPSRRTAFFVALAFACANAFLTYAHSGSSYVPGLFCVSLAAWVVTRHGRRKVFGVPPWAAAAGLAALGAMLWFPYVLSAPGILFLGMWRPGAVLTRENVRAAAGFTVVFLVLLVLGFGLGARAAHAGSAEQARAWMANSSHGWSQNNKLFRLGTGLPRTFLFMGNDGILYRRFFRKDPYAPVKVRDLVRASLWKILLVDVFLLALLYELWRSRPRWALPPLVVGAAPVLLFAVFVFEPGSPERYFPAYPFVVLAAAWALRDFPRPRRVSQYVVALFLGAMIAANVFYMNRARIDREDRAAMERIAGVRGRMPGRNLLAILNNQDTLEYVANRSPLGPINRPAPLRLYDVIEPATARLPAWRGQFAEEALASWARGGEVWVSKRMWSERPLPEWNWVEGDDPRISWRDIPAFFGQLEMDGESGGPDGFARLARSEANVGRLQSVGRTPTQAGMPVPLALQSVRREARESGIRAESGMPRGADPRVRGGG